MPTFLSRDQIYRLLQRELPEGVYADGAPSAFYTTADMDSVAQVGETSYSNLERVYDNYFPSWCNERIADWEIAILKNAQDSSASLADRVDKVLTKLRSQRGIKKQDMIDAVLGVIGSTKEVELIEWGNYTGGWMLGMSQLGVETFLSGYSLLDATGANVQGSDGSGFGISADDWSGMREEAYTYEIRIYNYTLSADERALIHVALTEAEPSRSNHVITDQLTDADKLNGDT